MKIKTRLRLNSVISISVFILILLSLVWSLREIAIAERDMGLVDEMQKVASDRIMLRDDYLLNQGVQAGKQWNTKTEALRDLLALADSRFNQKDDKALLHDMRDDFDATASGFSRIIEDRSIIKKGTGKKRLDFTEAEARLINQIFLKAYSLRDSIVRLHESAQKKAAQARERSTLIILTFFLGGIIAVIINSVVTSRSLTKRIDDLGKGVEIIGAGDLDHRIAVEGDDELTALALTSNEMAAKLKQSYTSVDNLQKEIAERKRAEEGLLKERDNAQKYLEIAGVMIAVLDREGRVTLINPKGCEILGYDRKDIIGVDWFGIILPVRLRDEVKGVFLQLMAGSIKPVEYYENPVVTKTGVERIIAFHNTVLRDSASQIIGVLFSGEDITERKRAEQALRDAEIRYRLLFDQSPDGIVIIDPATTRLLEFNDTACRQLGYSREEFARLSITDLDVAEKPEDTRKRVAKVMVDGRDDFETLQRTRQGEIRNIHVTAQFTDMFGRSVYHCIWRDITEHRRLEAQYLHAQKMESIGTLAGGVAHDFNNILSAIIGYGHVTLMEMAEDGPQRKNIEHILEAADRAARLTKELLLFGRKQVAERKPVDLNEVVSMVGKFVRIVIGEDIVCKTMLLERPIPVYADSNQLEQVLMNLATNARDAMPGGGAFTVTTEQIDLAEDFTRAHGYGKSGSYAMITISDTGAGMDEATQERIFEPFFTTKEVGKGTGLGLAVVYGIIKDHEGFINVYSESGRGTTFRLYLPLIAPETAEETATLQEEAPVRGTETVLVAEDDEALRKLSRTVLTEYGYTVIEAVDGEEAVKKFMENKDRIQLLLFDLIMPKMNGKEASDEIRKIKPDMKVLFASGYAPDLLRQKASLEDGAHLVFKPISPRDLLRKVRSVLDGVK